MFEIDYSNMITSTPQLEVISETFNEEIGRKIDRTVERRVTTREETSDGSPTVAGPFGSFQKMISLASSEVYLDSLVPKDLMGTTGYSSTFAHKTKEECEAAGGTWVATDYTTLLSDIPQSFPFESDTGRVFDVKPTEVKIKMRTATGPGGESGRWEGADLTINNTDTVKYTDDVGDNSLGTITWGVGAYDGVEFTEGTLGFMNVTNYIQDSFKGKSDYRKKTVRDMFLGFGNQVSGKNLIRPVKYKGYKALTWDANNNYLPSATDFVLEWVVEEPRGARFGLYNTQRTSPSYKFSYHHFGHLRDMFEQGLDSKSTLHRSDEEIFGAPVVVNSINPTNPEIPKLMENTSRYNKTVDCTVVKPYIEDNYEGIPNPVNLQSEQLRVDVAGSIRSRQILAPGNVASNIRRR